MPWKNSDTRYSTMSIALHWVMVVLLAVVYACIEFRDVFPKGSGGRALIVEMHFMFGLTIFVLVWLRLFARALGVAPKIVPTPPPWQAALATLMHVALYVFMIGTPILGWLIVSAQGHSVMFYGIELPPLIGENKDLAKQIKEWHELSGTVGYWLIGLHALAGIYHHYIVRDNTALRMMPGKRATP
ncbi:cytochrome b [Pseudomonas palleroniana]|uniref:Cytochrome B n=1 Tax=Pseudomonas palleroniana TaxID=191390 RepID=A0A109FPE7_9PSED|nr:cytochrome b [Pseudomonas palleroniana]KWU48112.1 cytochrome B [Pseudomonas palleroniana]